MASLAALSTEYLYYQVTAALAGIPYNPTTDTVQIAFPLTGANPSTWFAAAWETRGTNYYFARALVGPTGGVVALSAGTYDVWLKITDSPEQPVRKVGTLTIT